MKAILTLTFVLGFWAFDGQLVAQVEKGQWTFGIGGGPNLLRFQPSFAGYYWGPNYWVEEERNKQVGFHGNFTASYQLHKVVQVHGALGISKLKSHMTISGFVLPDTVSTRETIDQRYLMLEAPVYLRLHLRRQHPPKYGISLFLELGLVYYKSIGNQSRYQRQENGVVVTTTDGMNMSGIDKMAGIGLAIGSMNTLALDVSSYKNDLRQYSEIWKLTLTRFFLPTSSRDK